MTVTPPPSRTSLFTTQARTIVTVDMARLTALTFLLIQILAVNAGDHKNKPHNGVNAGDYDNNNPYNFTFLADPGVFGPPLEVVHAYFGEWPDGIAVSSTGRLFSNFPGLEPGNVNNGTPGIFTVGELTSPSTEEAYPSVEINTPPCSGGAVDLTDPANPVGCGSADHLISVQSVVIDAKDRLWILDTGRPVYVFPNNGSAILVPSSYGGPKLVGVDLSTDTVFKTIVFPPEVALPQDSYLDDVRIDLRPNLTSSSGDGVAYITDASLTGQNAIIVVDLGGTGDSWRRLQGNPSVLPEPNFLPFVWGQPLYFVPDPGHPPPTGSNLTTTPPPGYLPVGSDGIALSPDGETLFYSPLASRNLYSVPTSLLRQRGTGNNDTATIESELAAAVVDYGQTGFSDGMTTDPSNGLIYKGNQEANAVVAFDPETGTTQTVVRDPRLGWVDSLTVADLVEDEKGTGETEGWLYFSSDQLFLSAFFWSPGDGSGDRKVRPFALFRVPLQALFDGGGKIEA